MRHLLRCSLALLLPLFLLVACGGSDGEKGDKGADGTSTTETTAQDAGSTTTSTERVLAADEVDAKASPFCATWAHILAEGPADTDGTPAEVSQSYKTHYGAILPLAKELDARAPDELKADTSLVVKVVDEVARTGSFEPFSRDTSVAAQKKLAKYVVAHCAKD